jgi:hypothetical protein
VNRTDARREISRDFTFMHAMNIALLALITLALWPLARLPLAFSLAKGFGLFFLVILAASIVLLWIQRALRVDDESHFDAFLLSNLAVSATALVCWAAFAALGVRHAAGGAPAWLAAILWLVGLLTCWMTYGLVSVFYSGTFYRYKNHPLVAAAYLLFALWPAAARFLIGWFVDLW